MPVLGPAERPEPGLLDGYGQVPLDEAIDPAGQIRAPYRSILQVFESIGPEGLSARDQLLADYRSEEGVVFAAQVEDRVEEQVFPLDPIPRLIGRSSWDRLSAGAAQRARALNAFLADVYGDRGAAADGDRPVAIVADGIIPDRLVRGAPGYQGAAHGLAPGGRPRATVYGLDLLTDQQGRWVVLEDNLQVPSGLGYVLANRRSAARAFPELHGPGLRSPEVIGALLHRALQDAAPPKCRRSTPQVAVLSDGPVNSAWFEHHTLATEMGVPVVRPDQLVADGDGIAALLGTGSFGIDVLYRRLGRDELLGGPPGGIETQIRAASRAGTVSIANVPGNGVADDKSIYAFVGPMIRYYLGEEPLLPDVGTWILAEPDQYDAVRGRMGELVIKPVDGSGGEGVMIGPDLTDEQVAAVEAAVAKAPHRFIAQEVIRFSTHPTLIGGKLRPRHVDLRIFALSGATTVVVPAGLTRVALESAGLLVNSSRGGGSKDTWLLE